MRSAEEEAHGLRATPVAGLRNGDREITVAHPRFWQRFPKAVEMSGRSIALRLLPNQWADVHELQGGEQLTEEFVLAFEPDRTSQIPLDWVRDPLRPRMLPSWYCASEAMRHLVPAAEDRNQAYLTLVNAAVDGEDTFEAKRERIDEFGWRNFGDVYGDHEAVRHQGPGRLISHYNNQYDSIAGFACQFFRSGDLRWLTLMEELARHVVDIDIYHATDDKPAYNGGLFWHTYHYTDADLATHRTYPHASRSGGGGPSAEHNYNTGLMLHYFLTGDPRSRDAAVGLGNWVVNMDDGERTPLRWLSRRPTGLASASGSIDYHGPGRGSGNSLVALVNAFRLTGGRRYLSKAEQIVTRCIHPADDIAARRLLDAERRWYYTIFLQALGYYLDAKAELGELDSTYAYARASLLRYARWMAEHEYPYLDKPAVLEYPTETWAAQDMRKSEVFKLAAKHAQEADRAVFLERSTFFFDYSVKTLTSMPTRTLARPVAILLSNGYAHAFFQKNPGCSAPPPSQTPPTGEPLAFVPQRKAATRRLAILAVAALLLAMAAVLTR
jgi:hypothetical protein